METPIAEVPYHKCFIADLVSFPCITYVEMWALRRKGWPKSSPD
jgi:hypothetical protein